MSRDSRYVDVKKNAVDALYALGVGANLRPEDQVNLIDEVIQAVMQATPQSPQAEWRSVTEHGSFDSKGRFYIHYGAGSRRFTRDIGETPWVEVQS